MTTRRPGLLWLLAAVIVALGGLGLAACNAPASSSAPTPSTKKAVEMDPVSDLVIELPDLDPFSPIYYDFGEDFHARVNTKLTQSGRYLVTDPVSPPARSARNQSVSATAATPAPDTSDGCLNYSWEGSTTPAARVQFKVDALSFQTGSRGERMFYGFNERMKTPFNDGTRAMPNEFPLRDVAFEPNWFDRTFDAIGGNPFGSQAGLDLGDGFSINALMAWLTVKYALYHSEVHLEMIVSPYGSATQSHLIQVTGDGYFFDVAGAYAQYSGGISLARRDAMFLAAGNAFDASFSAIDRVMTALPLVARIDNVVELGDGTPLYLLGTGADAAVPAGTRYEVIGSPGAIIQVSGSCHSGSVGKLVAGDPKTLAPGMTLRETKVGASPSSARVLAQSAVTAGPSSSDTIQQPWTNLPESRALQSYSSSVISQNTAAAIAESLTETALLAYRIWRYFQYDQDYQGSADSAATYAGSPNPGVENQNVFDLGTNSSWTDQVQGDAWAKQIGLDQAPAQMGSVTPVVAVIDSGIDYNHPAIHDSVWVNPKPSTDVDGNQDRFGWDFIAGDARPYDDGYHGTEVASAVLAVAPKTKVMALKAFNPWGVTSSAALYAAFAYAVDHGAQVILCAWASRPLLYPKSLEMGIIYAQQHGVAVVAAAGDRGDDLASVPAYPAVFAKTYDNVLAVTGVNAQDQLVMVSGHEANHDPSIVGLAAPGESVRVAQPRNHQGQETASGVAAGLAAGALSRQIGKGSQIGTYRDWISGLLNEADVIPGLQKSVLRGLRLHVR